MIQFICGFWYPKPNYQAQVDMGSCRKHQSFQWSSFSSEVLLKNTVWVNIFSSWDKNMERLLKDITFNAHYSSSNLSTQVWGTSYWSHRICALKWKLKRLGCWKHLETVSERNRGARKEKKARSGKNSCAKCSTWCLFRMRQLKNTDGSWDWGSVGFWELIDLDCPMVPWSHDLHSLEVFAAIERLQDPPLVCDHLDHGPVKGHSNKTTQDQLVKRLLEIHRHSQHLFGRQRYPRQKLLSEIGHFSTDSFNIQLTVVWCGETGVQRGSSPTWISPWNAPCAVDSSAVFKMGSPKHGEQGVTLL